MKNGDELLAKLPVVPGFPPTLRAEVPDDDVRLEAEGFITGLQEEVVDVVVQREVFLQRIENRIDAGQLDEAKTMMDRLYALPDRDDFRERIRRYADRVFTNDPLVKRKITRLMSDSRQVVDRFLDPQPVERLARQLIAKRAKRK